MNTVNSLMSLGLNELEARIYIQLLSCNPATGYKIAQAIGKPVSNCYKALEMLAKKGAIEIEEGKKRLYTPSSPAEFLRRLKQQIQENFDIADKELKRIKPVANDTRIYQMTNPGQIFERSKTILKNAKKFIVADVFPLILGRLSAQFEQAGGRKVDVSIKCYREISIRGVRLISESRDRDIANAYPGQWLKIVADARVHIIAFLSNDLQEVYNAVWSESPLLSILHFNAIKSEMLLDRINEAVNTDKSVTDIKRILKDYSTRAKKFLPGYTDLAMTPQNRPRGKNDIL